MDYVASQEIYGLQGQYEAAKKLYSQEVTRGTETRGPKDSGAFHNMMSRLAGLSF